jgi:hypothetical protein
MPTKFLTPDEARVMLEWRDRRNAEIRAKARPAALTSTPACFLLSATRFFAASWKWRCSGNTLTRASCRRSKALEAVADRERDSVVIHADRAVPAR